MQKNQYSQVINFLNNLKNLLFTTFYKYDFKTQVEINFEGDGFFIRNPVKFNITGDYDDFKYSDYDKLNKMLHRMIDLDEVPGLAFQLTFNSNEEDYDDEPNEILITSDDFSDTVLNVKYDLSALEQSFINKRFKPYEYLGTVFVKITKDKFKIVTTDFKHCDKDHPLFMLVEKVSSVNKLFQSLFKLDKNCTNTVPQLVLPDEEQIYFRPLYQKEMKDIHNYFEEFLKDAILEDQDTYLWINKGKNKDITEAIVIEHHGYDFNWNHYDPCSTHKDGKLPKVHSYRDKLWSPSDLMLNFKNDNLSGFAVREISGNYNGRLVEEYVLSKIEDVLTDDIFSEDYMTFKLSLTNGSIKRLQFGQEDKSQLFGLNKDGRVILSLEVGDSYSYASFVKDKELLRKRLNQIIMELTIY